jgi:hypothetical protein
MSPTTAEVVCIAITLVLWGGSLLFVMWLSRKPGAKPAPDERYVRWEAPQSWNCRCAAVPLVPLHTNAELRQQLKTKAQLLTATQKELAELRASKGMQVLEDPTYHDVVVQIKGQDYRLFDHSYGLRLTCTRAGGWELWNMWGGKEELLGGEFAGLGPFSISVQGMLICQEHQ